MLKATSSLHNCLHGEMRDKTSLLRVTGCEAAELAEKGKADEIGGVCRWLVVAEDDSLYFLERRQIVWQREEGLASITAAMFLDLPSSTIEGNAQQLETRATLMDRINAEILTFKVCLSSHTRQAPSSQ